MMKKTILLFLIAFSSVNLSEAQEWFTSLDIAKRLAIVQDKMLFVMWEKSTEYSFPVQVRDSNGITVIADLFKDENINKIIWEHFVPVKIPEYKYEELFDLIKDTRTSKYINKFNDDSVKIMDANGNILNISAPNSEILNLPAMISKYALNTVFLKPNMMMYAKNKNFTTSFKLAVKVYDYAIFNDKKIKKEIIDLANIYVDEANTHLVKTDLSNKLALSQKCELTKLKAHLVLGKPRKVLRQLKNMNTIEIDKINQSLLSFLYYTAFKMLEMDDNALLWKSKVSLVDLKRTQLLINSNN